MIWQTLTLLAAGLFVASFFFWRARLSRERAASREKLEKLLQQQQQEALKGQSEQEALLNSMVEGLLLLDEKGRIRLANRACLALFGLTPEVHGKTLIEATRSHELDALVKSLETQPQVLGYELKLNRPGDRCFQINAAALPDGRGTPTGAVLVFHDVSRIKKLERTREEFVANVSHELRTPLSLIKGYTETLLGGAKDNPEVAAKFLHTIDRNAERLRALIEDLLTISQLETGRMKLDLQTVNIAALAGKVLAEFQGRADGRKVRLVNAAPELWLRADILRLEQVLTNLIDNAVKYGRAEGTVTVEAHEQPAGWAEICIRDDGPGIPAESIERVFERFYRVDKARSREQGGTGLGLSIVKHIVQSHGGRVWVESQTGHGAAFYFTLPADKAPQPA